MMLQSANLKLFCPANEQNQENLEELQQRRLGGVSPGLMTGLVIQVVMKWSVYDM